MSTPAPADTNIRGPNHLTRIRGLDKQVLSLCDTLLHKGTVVKCNITKDPDTVPQRETTHIP